MKKQPDKKIILEDGQEYYGYSFGSDTDKILEIVFNTSPVGYQEILSDPSYTYQAVVMTYPLIGNCGINNDDFESDMPSIGALVVREYCTAPSNFRYSVTLDEIMKKYDITGICGIDTRKLARHIRSHGTSKAIITYASKNREECINEIGRHEIPADAVSKVSRKSVSVFEAQDEKFRVAAIDCGIKSNIIRTFLKKSCSVTVFPWNTRAEEIINMDPDGVFISNGPGNPEDVTETIETVRQLSGRFPMFGICLGHQIIALAYGAKTYKLKFGHRGGNHPVKDLGNGKIDITSQNHSYAVDEKSLPGTSLTVTHINLLDGTVEGLENKVDRVMSVQYHPESAPGPRDCAYLFDRFVGMMEESRR